MEELKRVGIFAKVVNTGSFSEAARQLGVAKSAVSKQVSLLEAGVGIRLLNRTTRNLSLTEAGEIFYRRSLEILNQTELALSELREYQQEPTGTLRVTSPISFGTAQLVPVVKTLRTRYPSLKIELLFDDHIINMVEHGVDLSIRVGWMQESNLVAKKICEAPMVLFSSPEYLQQKEDIQQPCDLTKHSWISLTLLSSPLRWTFHKRDQIETIQMQNQLKTNSVNAIVSMVKQGLGVSAIAKYVIESELQSGELVELLPDFSLKPIGIYAVYPHRDHAPPKVRVFMECLSERCMNASWKI